MQHLNHDSRYLWTGDICLDSGVRLTDVSLGGTATAGPSITAGPLCYLALVDVSRIPLHFIVGPPLEVWSSELRTEEWFSSLLLPNDGADDASGNQQAWWQTAVQQSPIGILTATANGAQPDHVGCDIMEILFYAVKTSENSVSLPTPPTSSPSSSSGTVPHQQPSWKINAIPLSSKQQKTSETNASNTDHGLTNGQTDLEDHTPVKVNNLQSVVKRKTMDTLFDEATEQRWKAKRHGGESVAAFASKHVAPANSLSHRRSLSIDTSKSTTAGAGAHAPSPRLRSPSLTSESRPTSRKGVPDGQHRPSSLSRVSSINEPESNTVEDRNKDLISRMVMAGMRMYGLQRKKKGIRQRPSSAVDSPTAEPPLDSGDAAADAEYKLIYHQVYKGVSFAFRRQIATVALGTVPSQLQDAVDRLLDLYCQDPCNDSGKEAQIEVEQVTELAPR